MLLTVPLDCVKTPVPVTPRCIEETGRRTPPLRLKAPQLPVLSARSMSPALSVPPDWLNVPVPKTPTLTATVESRPLAERLYVPLPVPCETLQSCTGPDHVRAAGLVEDARAAAADLFRFG